MKTEVVNNCVLCFRLLSDGEQKNHKNIRNIHSSYTYNQCFSKSLLPFASDRQIVLAVVMDSTSDGLFLFNGMLATYLGV